MVCSILKKNKKVKEFVLNRKIKKLQEKIDNEVENIILMYPVEASRMDNIQNSFPSMAIKDAEIKISATKRLLSNISKN